MAVVVFLANGPLQQIVQAAACGSEISSQWIDFESPPFLSIHARAPRYDILVISRVAMVLPFKSDACFNGESLSTMIAFVKTELK